jgi:hypothetical protein
VTIGREHLSGIAHGDPSDRHHGIGRHDRAQVHDRTDAHLGAIADAGAVEDADPGGEEDLVAHRRTRDARGGPDEDVRADVHGMRGARPDQGVLHHDDVRPERDRPTLGRQHRAVQDLASGADLDVPEITAVGAITASGWMRGAPEVFELHDRPPALTLGRPRATSRPDAPPLGCYRPHRPCPRPESSAVSDSVVARSAPAPATVSTLTLSTFVVGSMVGAGVFSLPGTFSAQTGVVGSLVAWAVAGTGMFMLALVFQRLAARRPSWMPGSTPTRAGFGRYLGFLSAFGYWASACASNVFYWVFIMSTVGAVVPAVAGGDTPVAVAVSSAGLWVFFLLVRRGAREAAAVNRIVSVAKVLPIVAFVFLCLFAFDPAVFAANISGPPTCRCTTRCAGPSS